MGCCTRGRLWRTIAIFSMVFSFVMVAVSICGLLTYYCIFNPGVSSFRFDNFYLTYVVYFYSGHCVDDESDFIVWKPQPSERTWGWSIAYLVVSSLWFFASILLINAPNYWKSTTGLWLTYPWLFITFAVLCTDVAASVMYGLDYPNLENIDKLLSFISISHPGNESISYSEYLPVPTILMVAIFSKLILGWILVFISFLAIFILLVNVGKPENLVLQTRAPLDYYAPATVNPAFESEMTETENLDSPQQQHGRVNHHTPMYFEEIPWDAQNNLKTPQILPRISTRYPEEEPQQERPTRPARPPRPATWQQQSPQESLQDWSAYQEQTNSPKSILKTPKENRYPQDVYSGHKPWSYLPPASQSPVQRQHNQHQNEEYLLFRDGPGSASTRYSDQSTSSLYY